MDKKKLISAIREVKNDIRDIIDEGENVPEIAALKEELTDAKELLIVLMHIIDGKEMSKAFGAPGDWGYDTAIGQALAAQA